MTSRRKKKQQDGFIKKVSSLFNLDTVRRYKYIHIYKIIMKYICHVESCLILYALQRDYIIVTLKIFNETITILIVLHASHNKGMYFQCD